MIEMQINFRCFRHRLFLVFAGISCWLPVTILSAEDQLTDLQGKTISGSVASIDSTGTVSGEGIPDGMRLDQLAEIDTGRKVNSSSTLPTIWMLGNGRVLTDSVISNTVRVDASMNGQQWEIPVEDIRAIVFQSNVSEELIRESIKASTSGNDRVIAQTSRGPQSVDGTIKSIDKEKVNFVYKDQERTISLDKVLAVIFADYGIEPIQGTSALVTLTDGSRIHCAVEKLAGDKLEIKLPGGSQHQFAWDRVSSIGIESDRVVFLANLEPTETQHQPIVTVEQPWKRNLSVQGNPIRLRIEKDKPAREFKSGIGMHSYAQLVFANEKNCNRLLAIVGIDVETEGRGDCRVAVTGDGIELWTKEITGNDLAVEVDVDITGYKSIGLVVYPGNHLDMADHVDWAMVRMLKTQQ